MLENGRWDLIGRLKQRVVLRISQLSSAMKMEAMRLSETLQNGIGMESTV
jgi:hypothetical protein